jgi:hypothetical protein
VLVLIEKRDQQIMIQQFIIPAITLCSEEKQIVILLVIS